MNKVPNCLKEKQMSEKDDKLKNRLVDRLTDINKSIQRDV